MKPVIVPEDLRRRHRRPKLTAAERRVADRAACQQRLGQEQRARVDQVIEEFGGAADAAGTMLRLGEELLYCRWVMQDIVAFMDKIQSEEPFAIIGAGPLWKPPDIRRWWFR